MRVRQIAMIAAIRAHGSPQWKYEAYLDIADAVAQSPEDFKQGHYAKATREIFT